MLINTSAVVVLALAAAGGLATALWPFVPALLPALPLSTVLALAGWFLVASRTRTMGIRELFAEVQANLGDLADGDSGGEPTGESTPVATRYTG